MLLEVHAIYYRNSAPSISELFPESFDGVLPEKYFILEWYLNIVNRLLFEVIW